MTPRVTKRPTHNLVLTDGVTSLGLTLCDPRGNPNPMAMSESPMPKTSLQTTQGDPDYGSFVLPFSNVTQKDWSGGRAWHSFSKDSTRFYDSQAINSIYGDILLGPKASEGIDPSTKQTSSTNEADWYPIAYRCRAATPFTASASFTIRSVQIRVRCDSMTPGWTGTVIAKIFANTGGLPGSELATGSLSGLDASPDQVITIPITQAITSGTVYWMAFDLGTAGSAYSIRYDPAATGQKIWFDNLSTPAPATVTDDQALCFTLSARGRGRQLFFEYRGSLMAAIVPEEGGASSLLLNGYRGKAQSNAGDKTQLVTGLNLTGVDLTGKIAKIVSGPGAGEMQPWRVIDGNTEAGVINVSPAWNITHTTATEFVILGCDSWQSISTGTASPTQIPSLSTYLTAPVTDVLVVDETIYLAQGDDVNICRIRLDPSSGNWSAAAADGTNKATFLELITDTSGKRKVWKALAVASKVAPADVQSWGNNLTFGTDLVCGNPHYRITNLVPYGTPQAPWVIKEDSFGSISWSSNSGVYAEVPLREMAAVRDERNGQAACSFGVYLMFSLLDGMERYYDNRLDDIGPNRDEGMPVGRQGNITQLIPYPGGLIACLDGGYDGSSSILYWNQIGWHELYRSGPGSRIRGGAIQVIPRQPSRLWFCENENLRWLPIAPNPRKTSGYRFAASGSLTTAWYKTSFAEVNKFWRSVTIFTEGLSAGHQTISVSYQVDDASDLSPWIPLPSAFGTSPVQEIPIASNYAVSGKQIRFKFTLSTDDDTRSPRIIAYNISAIVRIPPATAWTVTVLSTTYQQNQQGRWEELTQEQTRSLLASWASSKTRATPLTMLHEDPAHNNRLVFIDPASVMPTQITVEAGGQVRTKKVLNFALVEMEPV